MKHVSRNHKRFVHIFLLSSCSLLVLFIFLNVIADPFTVHQTPAIDRVNIVKPILTEHDRLYRAIEIARKKPKAIIFGSSRAAAIDPNDVKALTGVEIYNASMAGASFDQIYHYFEHALHHQPDLKLVIIGLDFCAFNQNNSFIADFRLNRLKNQEITWQDFNASLLSFDALKASLKTFKANFFPIAVVNPILEKGDLSYLKSTLKADYNNYKSDPKKIEMFKKIVEKCKELSIELKLFFYPVHAVYWEAIYRSHLWPQFEDLKRQLSAIYPIWDFSGFNCVTTHTTKEYSENPFYFECSHFRPLIGKMIEEKIFNYSNLPLNFGFYLTPFTIEQALDQMRKEAHSWLENREDIMPKIKQAKNW